MSDGEFFGGCASIEEEEAVFALVRAASVVSLLTTVVVMESTLGNISPSISLLL